VTTPPGTGPPLSVEDRRALAEQVGCADIVDALGRRHRHRAHLLDLVSPTPGRLLFGPAATISFFPTCAAAIDPALHDFRTLFRSAVGEEPEGKVLVLASNGQPGVSVGGGTKLSRIHHYGLDGVLTDGRLRDFAELQAYEFAAYCAGEALEAGGSVITPHQANLPVVLRGVGIMPGDYVFADGSGAAVIPRAEVDDVLLGALAVKEEDAGFRQQIASERGGPLDPSGGGER
jgi:4-hydroxy-4-methyl-2-oxoglutarate aldolase